MRLLALVFTVLPLLTMVCAAAETDTKGVATHSEIRSIGKSPETKFTGLASFCLGTDDNVYGCDAKAKRIRVITPDDKLVKDVQLPFASERAACAPDGSLYVSGRDILARLDKDGKVAESAKPEAKTRWRSRISGIAITDKYVFVTFGSGWKARVGGEVVRFDRDLKNPKSIAKKFRGCCARLDIAAHNDLVCIAENGRHRVVRMDTEGKVLSSFGKRIRKGLEGFGTCCNPMNLTFGPKGEIYTAEAGFARVKRFSSEGEFVGLVGEASTRRFAGKVKSCSHIPVAVNKDGSLVFVHDIEKNLIHVLRAK